jgi:hypothetical protein
LPNIPMQASKWDMTDFPWILYLISQPECSCEAVVDFFLFQFLFQADLQIMSEIFLRISSVSHSYCWDMK